jgi:hypothetical protein
MAIYADRHASPLHMCINLVGRPKLKVCENLVVKSNILKIRAQNCKFIQIRGQKLQFNLLFIEFNDISILDLFITLFSPFWVIRLDWASLLYQKKLDWASLYVSMEI